MEEFSKRFLEVRKKYGPTQAKFEIKTGLSQANINHYENGRSKPNTDKLQLLSKAIPELNIDWLLYGNGEMLKKGTLTLHEPQEVYTKVQTGTQTIPLDLDVNEEKIPVLSMNRLAALKTKEDLITFYNQKELPEGFTIVPELAYCNGFIEMIDNTMAPTIEAGERTFCELQTDLEFIEYGKAYIINIKGRIIARRIYAGKSPNTVRIVADNPNYPEMEIDRFLIRYLFIIHKFIKNNTDRRFAA